MSKLTEPVELTLRFFSASLSSFMQICGIYNVLYIHEVVLSYSVTAPECFDYSYHFDQYMECLIEYIDGHVQTKSRIFLRNIYYNIALGNFSVHFCQYPISTTLGVEFTVEAGKQTISLE